MDPIILLSKILYIKTHLDAIKEDPFYWITLPHEKQVEIHKIKEELDKYFGDKNGR